VETVYAAAQDIEGLAQYITDVESIKVLERQETPAGPVTVSAWVGLIPEFSRKVRWSERDHWLDAEHRCDFELVSGDLDAYSGEWTFEPADDGTVTRLTVRYEYNVPLVGALIKKLVQKKMQDSVESIQAGLKRRAEGA
jgi:uncharacterized membrane protein